MQRRTQLVCAGVAALTLAGGLVFWLCTPRQSGGPATVTVTPTPDPGRRGFDPAHEAEETVPAAELAALRQGLQDRDAFARLGAAERLARVSAPHRSDAVRVLL